MRPRPPCSPVLLLAALLPLLTVVPPAASVRADIQEPIDAHNPGQRFQRRNQQRGTTPANGEPQEVQIHQGETVEIILHARGQIGKSIEFLIRSWPTHGTLEGLPEPTGRDSARITYVHREGDGPGSDMFTYAVKTAGSAVSAAVPVTVTALDSPPSLAVSPAELDFGAVKTGDRTRATITLENRGGGVAAGIVDPPAPWAVDGAAAYRLAHGETQSFQIVFRPSYGGSYVESAHFHAEEGRGGVRLIGTGIGPAAPSGETSARNEAAAAVNPMAAKIARDNAAVLAAGNPGHEPSAAETLAAVRAPKGTAAALPMYGSNNGGADASSPTPSVAAAAGPGVAASGTLDLPAGGADSVVLNDAAVKAIEDRGVGTTTIDLAWTPPRPTPRSYRVELRYLSLDDNDNLRVDWRPYAKADIRPTQSRVTARVSGLPAEMRQYVRVVAVDDEGRLAAPSPVLMFETRAASTWWHITPLKMLFAALALCLGLVVYRKWEERQILQDLDDRRAAREAELTYKR